MKEIRAMFLFFQISALTRTVLISLIALLTLLGIMLRPYKISEPHVLDHAPYPVLLVRPPMSE